MKYNLIILNGFRGTGKSTIGKYLAKKISWDFMELDDLITKNAGKSIDQITENGTNWKLFRKTEHEILKQILNSKNSVISLGGGTCVNDLYGEINFELINRTPTILHLLLTGDKKVLELRIRRQELRKQNTKRPMLNENFAKKIQTLIKKYTDNPEKQKEILVEKIVEDSMATYEKRKPLYKKLSLLEIDTSESNLDKCINQILKLI